MRALRQSWGVGQAVQRFWAATGCTDGVDETLAGRIRARQLGTLLRLSGLMMAASALNGIMLFINFQATHPRAVVAWAGVLCFVILAEVWRLIRMRGKSLPRSVSARTLRHVSANAFLFALVWGAAAILFLPGADADHAFVISNVTIGMAAGGSVAFVTIPRAALVYNLTMGCCVLIALGGGPPAVLWNVAIMFTAFVVIIASVVMTVGRQTAQHIIDQQLIADTAASYRDLQRQMQEREDRARRAIDAAISRAA
jgi:hypothetical protein